MTDYELISAIYNVIIGRWITCPMIRRDTIKEIKRLLTEYDASQTKGELGG